MGTRNGVCQRPQIQCFSKQAEEMRGEVAYELAMAQASTRSAQLWLDSLRASRRQPAESLLPIISC